MAFRLSTGFHVEDLASESQRSIYLNFQEFLEALGRVAEGGNLVPFGEKDNDIKWTLKARTSLPLVVKLEALFQLLLKKHNLGEKFPYLLMKKTGFVEAINGVLQEQMRQSVAAIQLGSKDGKTFIRSNLQKALNVAVLTKKMEVKLNIKQGVKDDIDTPYH